MRVFLAGASGVIGKRLLPLLLQAGHAVTGTTRSQHKADAIAKRGAVPVVVDVFDVPALESTLAKAMPDVVIHQLTDLPDVADPAAMEKARPANARLRRDGTANLVAAACQAGAGRFIAQSIAFSYAQGPQPHVETDPLAPPDTDTARGVIALEDAVIKAPGLQGMVLRYGRLYGPGTWTEMPQGEGPLHVDAAAHAAFLAVSRGAPGIYNIAEEDGTVSSAKARLALGFDPDFRLDPGLDLKP